jgi:hypothetical protein
MENFLAAPDMNAHIIEALVKGRLLRREDRAGIARIELTHDVLTGVVLRSRDARRNEKRKSRPRPNGSG